MNWTTRTSSWQRIVMPIADTESLFNGDIFYSWEKHRACACTPSCMMNYTRIFSCWICAETFSHHRGTCFSGDGKQSPPPHFSSPPLLFGLAMLVVLLTGDDLTWINRLFKIWRPKSLTAPRHLSLDHCHYPTPTHFSRSLFPPLAPLLHGTQLPVIDSQSLTQSFALFNHLHRLVLWRFRGLMGKLLVCFQQSCRVLGY